MNNDIENYLSKINELNEKLKELENESKRIIDSNQLSFKNQLRDKQNEIESIIAEKNALIVDFESKLKEKCKQQRPEDAQKIHLLEVAIVEKSELVNKLFNELKHYQNELINREISYNKLFNVNPNIGELNVIEKKIKVENLITESKTKTLRFLPKLSDDRDKDMKFLKTTSTPRRKAVSSLNTQKSKEKVNSKGVSSSLAATASTLKSVGGNSNSSTLILNPQSPSQQSNSNLRKSTPS